MTPQEREDIESEIQYLQMRIDGMPPLFDDELEKMGLEGLLKFARQQLNLRVDGQRLMEMTQARGFGWKLEESCWEGKDVSELEALVLECFTTEEKP